MTLVGNDTHSGFFINLHNSKKARDSAPGFCVLCGCNQKTKDYGNHTVLL